MENNFNQEITPNDLKSKIKELKLEQKAMLRDMIADHDAELKKIRDEQKVELQRFKEAQVGQKEIAKKTKEEVRIQNKEFYANLKNEYQTFLQNQVADKAEFEASHTNLVDIYKFDLAQKEALDIFAIKQRNAKMIFDSQQKNKVNKVDLDWKNEIVKFRLEQFEKFHRREDVLRYDEYLLEQKQKAEIEALMPKTEKTDSNNSLKDADKESGNVVTLFFKHLWRDIKVAIKTKPSIIFGLLVMLTGFIFGFTINKFIKLAYNFTAEYAYVGLLIFIYELAGVFNMVNGFGMCTSRRLKSVVSATIATVLMLITGILWIYATGHYLTGSENLELVPLTSSIIIVSLITSIIGVVGGYFTYDREALKVRR